MIRSILTIAFLIALGSCGNAQEYPHLTTISGRITVADSVDASGDFSGFTLSIVLSDTTGRPDTLYHAVTGLDGAFTSQVFVPSQGRYPMMIGRYGNNLANGVVVLGQEDLVTITAEFPGIEQTFVVDSPENSAIETFDRVTRSYNRVVSFLNIGAMSADSIPGELMKWSNLYWDMKDQFPGTLASRLAIIESINILDGWNDSLLVARVENLQTDENLGRSISILGTGAFARERGLDATLAFFKQRKDASKEVTNRRYLEMARIQLMADSLRIDDAIASLEAYEKEFTDDASRGWARVFKFDMENLSLGKPMPTFSLTMEGGGIISSDSLRGSPYVLEIASLRDQVYQEQYPQMQGYFHVYNPMGVAFLTLPIEDNVVTIDGFFEERQQLWPLAEAGTWREGDIINKLNITSLPVRFLVDANGNIIRKYSGNLGPFISDIQKMMETSQNQ